MSQDLLAAFGDAPAQQPKPGGPASSSSFSFFDDFSAAPAGPPPESSQAAQPALVNGTAGFSQDQRTDGPEQDDDDDWGDFEGSAEVTAASSSKPPAYAQAAPAPSSNVPIATQFSRWMDEEDDGFRDYSQSAAVPSKTGAKWDFTKPAPAAATQPKVRDPNVLFDAEDEPPPGEDEDEDDFGDFEDAEPSVKPVQERSAPLPPAPPRSGGMGDLLGMDDAMAMPSIPQQQMKKVSAPSQAATSSSLLDLGDLSLEDDSSNAWRSEEPAKPPIHGFGTLGALSKPKSPTKPTAASSTSIAPARPPARPTA